jgi:hypothetical protein
MYNIIHLSKNPRIIYFKGCIFPDITVIQRYKKVMKSFILDDIIHMFSTYSNYRFYEHYFQWTYYIYLIILIFHCTTTTTTYFIYI